MQSFEEFSKDKINLMNEKNKDKNKKMTKYEELMLDEEDEMKQEMEIAYLQKLVESWLWGFISMNIFGRIKLYFTQLKIIENIRNILLINSIIKLTKML